MIKIWICDLMRYNKYFESLFLILQANICFPLEWQCWWICIRCIAILATSQSQHCSSQKGLWTARRQQRDTHLHTFHSAPARETASVMRFNWAKMTTSWLFMYLGQRFAMMQLKIILAEVLSSFYIDSPVPESDLNLLGELVLVNQGGIHVSLRARCW